MTVNYQLKNHESNGVTYSQIVIPASHRTAQLTFDLAAALNDVDDTHTDTHTPSSHQSLPTPKPAATLKNTDNSHTVSPVMLWIHEATSADDRIASTFGFTPYRDLWQMRCRLPIVSDALAVESSKFQIKSFCREDIDQLIAMNNRAFHWHPEQGELTPGRMRDLMSKPWFDAGGILLCYRHKRLVAFCWTKIHEAPSSPLGELYVVAVDPDFSGKGLGMLVTLAGLHWLSDRGLQTGMLYVESDNYRALKMYRRIGFLYHHTNRAYWYVP